MAATPIQQALTAIVLGILFSLSPTGSIAQPNQPPPREIGDQNTTAPRPQGDPQKPEQ